MPHEKKPPVVFDNGSGMMKCGFSGDDAPRSVFPSVVARPLNDRDSAAFGKGHLVGDAAQQEIHSSLVLGLPLEYGIVANWDDMEKIWRHAFYNEMHVKPEEHNVMLTTSPLNPKPDYERMAQIMFETFTVPGMTKQMDAMLSLAATGRTTGVVLDCGHAVTHVVPISDGFGLLHAIKKVPMGGHVLNEQLYYMLVQRGVSSMSTVRKIKEELCYVAEDGMFIKDTEEKEFKMPDGKIITVGAERFACPETLFNPRRMGVQTSDGLHQLIFKSLERCERDVRFDELCNNIVLSGGTTALPGLPERLQKELKDIAPWPVVPKVVAPPGRKHLAWIGGSILSSLSTFQWVPKSEYDEVGPSILHAKRFNSKL